MSQGFGINEVVQTGSERFPVTFGEDESGIADYLRDCATIGTDYRNAAGHGLDENPSELFLPIGHCAGRKNKDIQTTVDIR